MGLYLPAYDVPIENDVYSQIGLVMLIGLAAKNSILIVAFAKAEHEKGRPLAEAALEAARLRLRPLLMTSFAFILGCLPLWTASGAGAIARQVMGTAVIGGMVVETFIGRFLVPAIFCVVEKISSSDAPSSGLTPSPAAGE
jgi:HAE1 family hydrophobic/amphiphilic exporter-1